MFTIIAISSFVIEANVQLFRKAYFPQLSVIAVQWKGASYFGSEGVDLKVKVKALISYSPILNIVGIRWCFTT